MNPRYTVGRARSRQQLALSRTWAPGRRVSYAACKETAPSNNKPGDSRAVIRPEIQPASRSHLISDFRRNSDSALRALRSARASRATTSYFYRHSPNITRANFKHFPGSHTLRRVGAIRACRIKESDGSRRCPPLPVTAVHLIRGPARMILL